MTPRPRATVPSMDAPSERSGGAAAQALLVDIRAQRELRDHAAAAASRPATAWLETSELDRRARDTQSGLEALVRAALETPQPPTDDALADAAGLSPGEVAALRAGPEPVADGRRRRWFRR